MRSLTDLAGDLSVPLEQLLTTLRIVATRAGVDELADWAAKELEGYAEDDELPPHRRWHLTITASLHNPMQGFVQDSHVGDLAIAEKYREKATVHCCRDGIGQIEDVLSSNQGGERMAVEHPNLARLINEGPMLGGGWTCTHASATFSAVHLKLVVDRTRQTALKFCLGCEARGVDLQYEEASNPTPPQERKAWMELLKAKTTQVVVRGAWDAARDLIFTAGSAGTTPPTV